MFTEINPTSNRQTVKTLRQSQRPESMSGSGYLKFRNDRGVPEILILKYTNAVPRITITTPFWRSVCSETSTDTKRGGVRD